MGFRDFFRRSKPVPTPSAIGSVAYPSFLSSDLRKNSTVSACVQVIANAISDLPLNLFFKNPSTGARQKAGWHPLHTVLRWRPNAQDTPTLFLSTLVRNILERGNAYVFVSREGESVVALQLLNPDAVRESYDGWTVRFAYNGQVYTDAEILRISSLVTDEHGKGYAPVELARAAVLLGIQLDEYSLTSFANGLNTKILIDVSEATKAMTETEASAYARTVSDWIYTKYAGSANAGKPLLLFNNWKATELSKQSSNRDAELLESRKWQELEICKVFGVPPFLVNGSYDVKYGNLESAMTIFLNFCLSPYLHHIEQRLWTLLSPYEQQGGTYYFEFDFNALLRPDEASRADFYSRLFAMGAISPGQIAAKENIDPPAEGADARFVPANMMPLRQDVLDAYMASAKTKAASLVSGPPAPDPSASAGDQARQIKLVLPTTEELLAIAGGKRRKTVMMRHPDGGTSVAEITEEPVHGK